MLSIWEPILDLWESFLALKGKCELYWVFISCLLELIMGLWESIFGYYESIGGHWESIVGLYQSILSLCGSILGLRESISGFRNQFRAQDVDVGHLVIDFGTLGVNLGLYRILQIIFLENLITEFTNENLCISRGILVKFVCLLSENLHTKKSKSLIFRFRNLEHFGHENSIVLVSKSWTFWSKSQICQ